MTGIAQPPTVLAAGGVVLRERAGAWYVLVGRTPNDDGWRLPKGIRNEGEPIEATAVREVLEETGFRGTVVSYLGQASWTYSHNQVLREKIVHFFLMKIDGEETQPRDNEFSHIAWLPLNSASTQLQFESEREILQRARRMLTSQPRSNQ